MSGIIDIKEMHRQFKDKASKEEMEAFIKAQQDTISKLMAENSKLLEENEHLKGLFLNTNKELVVKVDTNKGKEISTLEPIDEELICDMEIRKLKDISMNRALNLDETKRFDILVKAKLAIRGKEEKPIDVTPKPKKDLKALMKAATKPEE
jgi:hypothetical protein